MKRIEKFDANGELIEVIDDRTLEYAQEERVRLIKHEATNWILENYPEFKQRNAAMGVYSAEENARIVDGIKSAVSRVDYLESEIMSKTDKLEVDLVSWSPPEV